VTVQSDSFYSRNLSDFTIYLQQAHKALLIAIAIVLENTNRCLKPLIFQGRKTSTFPQMLCLKIGVSVD